MSPRRRTRRRVVLAAACVAVGLGVALLAGGVWSAPPPTKLDARRKAAQQPLPLAAVKAISFMPTHDSWSNMWVHWQPDVIAAGYARVAALGANTVRVIIPPDTFGWPRVSETYASRLRTVLSLAADDGLHVQLTLFDQWGRFGEVQQSEQWVRSLFASVPFKKGTSADGQIAFVELINELDPGLPGAAPWASALLPVLEATSGRPVTVSTSGATGLAGLRTLKLTVGSELDFYDYHYYGPAGEAAGVLAQAAALAAPRVLFVGEVGVSTYTTGAQGLAYSAQYQLYSAVDADTRSLGLPDAAPWMLDDLAPGGVPAFYPRDPTVLQYGLVTVSGRDKPAAAVVARFFGGAAPPAVANGDFADVYAGVPQGWSTSYPQLGDLSVSPSVAFSGSTSVGLASTRGSRQAPPGWTTVVDVGVLEPGERLSARAWARGDRATGTTTVALSWFDGAGRLIGTARSKELAPGTTTWTALSVRASAPPHATYAVLRLGSWDNTGGVWFADVSAAVSAPGRASARR